MYPSFLDIHVRYIHVSADEMTAPSFLLVVVFIKDTSFTNVESAHHSTIICCVPVQFQEPGGRGLIARL